MVEIRDVLAHSRAKRAGVRPGDTLVSVNGHPINDVLDYRFYLTERRILLSLLRDGRELTCVIKKKEYDDIGLEFETPLMDKKHSCENKCIFCFIDQLPKGLRSSLYFKDDDSRLSFLHGNYITLTNLHDEDIDRIIRMHISPVNVSVHTTNPELRVRMMHNKRAGEVLSYMRRLGDAGISLCAQIVLCRGINDGEELMRSMKDLEALYPALQSTSIVPAGLTQYRDKLYPLTPYTPEECAELIRTVTAYGDACIEKYGTRLFYPADEWYVKAGISLPEDSFYEEYAQIENGVGMLTDLSTSFEAELACIEEFLPHFRAPRTVSVCTGLAAYGTLKRLIAALEARVDGLTVHTYAVRNDFFGPEITVAGLLTGKDMQEQLIGKPLGDELLIPDTSLRADGDLFLDGMTPSMLSDALGVRVTPSPSEGEALIKLLLGIE